MKTLLGFALVSITIAQAAEASPITYKCEASNGEVVADFIVDIDKRQIRWGSYTRYNIQSASDRFISAYEDNGRAIGGEVLVLDRLTGDYTRVALHMTSTEEEMKRGEPGQLTARKMTGRCEKQM
ncbi:MAG: hypothetical protein IPM70_18315 [Proteobacteria bacterium]|jgi:hypothetical protein|nr:hypothetical protein [Pseudomonadota bacterium]MBK9253711.1 hypothetical protein [Pseudomonadota bacterium]